MSGNKNEDMDPAAAEKGKRRQRNLSIALLIVGFVLLVYLVTLIRIGGAVTERTF